MTVRMQQHSDSFSEALYLIETLIDNKAGQKELRTALSLLSEDNLTEEEEKYLHNLVNKQKQ